MQSVYRSPSLQADDPHTLLALLPPAQEVFSGKLEFRKVLLSKVGFYPFLIQSKINVTVRKKIQVQR